MKRVARLRLGPANMQAPPRYGSVYWPALRAAGAALALLLLTANLAGAQLRVVKADLATDVETAARAGGRVRALLRVSVPEGYHLQSNAPRDPSLIPTTLTFAPLPGIRATEVVFPKATDFKLQGQSEPLAVFERQFVIGVHFAVAKDAAAGDLEVPARFRYQACNDMLCFAPVTAEVRWTLHIGGGAARAGQASPEYKRDRVGHRRGAAHRRDAPGLYRRAAGRGRERARHARRFRDRRQHRRVSADDGLPRLRQERGTRGQGAGALRRPGTAGHPPARVPRRARAQPHPVRAADDSDQPGDHRRRQQGRLPFARVRARCRVRRGDGRSCTACSAWS